MRSHPATTSSILALLACIAIGAEPARAATIYVNASAAGTDDGTSWENAFTDLQDALGAAAPGDAIWVAAGTYTPGLGGDTGASFQLESGVALYGGFEGASTDTALAQRNPALFPTLLSGDLGFDDVYINPSNWNINTPNSVHVVTASGVDGTARVDGFKIIAGYATSTPGGGVYAIGGSPAFIDCVFERNLAGFSNGGGVYVADGSPNFVGCSFRENYVHLGQGGGIFAGGAGSVTIVECTFTANQVVGCSPEGMGGAVSLNTTLPSTITRSVFSGNFARNFYPAGCGMQAWGGAIHNWSAALTIEACTFDGNWAHAGGAISNWADNVLVDNCVFIRNTAYAYDTGGGSIGGYGGAITSQSFALNSTRLVNCVFSKNTAGEGAGVTSLWNHDTVVENCIFWGNTANGGDLKPLDWSIMGNFSAAFSCVQGLLQPIPGEDPPDTAASPGCIDENPFFVNPNTPDVHLQQISPCIDAGDNVAVPPTVTVDLAGNPRYFDDPNTPDGGNGTAPIVDMGVYEFGSDAATGVSRGDDLAVGSAASPRRDDSGLTIAPNPASGAVTLRCSLRPGDARASGTLEIFDAQGRSVFRRDVAAAGSEPLLAWNGVDDGGARLASGVYFARVTFGGTQLNRKLEIVR